MAKGYEKRIILHLKDGTDEVVDHVWEYDISWDRMHYTLHDCTRENIMQKGTIFKMHNPIVGYTVEEWEIDLDKLEPTSQRGNQKIYYEEEGDGIL